MTADAEHLNKIAQQYLWEKLDEAEQSAADTLAYSAAGNDIAVDIRADRLVDELESAEQGIGSKRQRQELARLAKSLLKDAGLEIAEDAPEFNRFLLRLAKARHDAARAELRLLQGDFSALTAPPPSPAAPPTGTSQRLREAIASFLTSRTTEGAWTAKTRDIIEDALDELLELVGDKPIREITKADLLAYQQAILKLPSNAPKKLPGRTTLQAIEEGTELGLEPISPKSVNLRLSRVRSLFNWLENADAIERNPAAALKDVTEKKGKRGARAALTDAEVVSFANACAQDAKSPAYRWVPLILAYTGARLEEVAQLTTADIREVEGIVCFDINGEDEKRIKTEASRRLVPVHSKLISEGLRDYVAGLPQGSLWPELKATQGVLSHSLSKWLNRRMKVTTTGRGKVVHSLRHTVSTKLTDAGAHQYLVEALLGHASKSITMNRYSKGPSPTKLQEVVEQIRYR
jgi:integrase